MKTIINCETGEILERELDAKELKQQATEEADINAAKAAAESEIKAKAAEREKILERLGITADEAALLLS
jgi:hypothetical protein